MQNISQGLGLLVELGFIFFFSLASLFLLRKVAKIIGLVDVPNLRKQHDGVVPLVGGIAVFVTLAQFIFSNPEMIPHADLFLASIAILTVIGALDDKYDISYKFRLIVQTALTILMMHYTEFELNMVGDILGVGALQFGWLSPFVTILAVLGAINAFNMVDGIDGLLGGISIVTFSSLAIVLGMHSQYELTYVCVVIVIALIPYVLLNLGLLGKEKRVFMGDAGSMMIGFTVIWLLLNASQMSGEPIMRPVTGLWLIALPLMDMAAVMYRRIKRGRSPFRPDRDHLHHICQRIGLSKNQTLLFICGVAGCFASIGIIGEFLLIPEAVMFFGFLICFALYSLILLRNWPYRAGENT